MVIQGFNEVQKDYVRHMGFRGILKMKMIEENSFQNFHLEQKKINVMKNRQTKYDSTSRYKDVDCFHQQGRYEFQDEFNSFVDQLAERIKLFRKSKHQSIELHNKQDENKQHRMLLYLDIIKSDVVTVERTRPVICHWTLEKKKMRETFEKDEFGKFRIGDFNDDFVEEELNVEAYEEMVMIKYRKLDMLIAYGINKFPENITLNHLKIKNRNDDVRDENSDDDEDNNGDDNDEAKKKNVGGDNIKGGIREQNENVKIREQQGKNKDEGGEDIEGVGGEEEETDNNGHGLDDMNLHDEGVENNKGGDNEEEQNAEGGGKQQYRLIRYI
uniref:Uncharacterized protein n=1 Tax=Lactuca sativa TaxID=4236 RepID=A0A9R1VCA9_LACSA|nr:hypothetical protein LSAT_V11C600327260 [Lactuca sativa]